MCSFFSLPVLLTNAYIHPRYNTPAVAIVIKDITKKVEALKGAITGNSLSGTVRDLVGDLIAALSEEEYVKRGYVPC